MLQTLASLITSSVADILVFLHALHTPIALHTSTHTAILNRLRHLALGETSEIKASCISQKEMKFILLSFPGRSRVALYVRATTRSGNRSPGESGRQGHCRSRKITCTRSQGCPRAKGWSRTTSKRCSSNNLVFRHLDLLDTILRKSIWILWNMNGNHNYTRPAGVTYITLGCS
jgi:hypothetical protein